MEIFSFFRYTTPLTMLVQFVVGLALAFYVYRDAAQFTNAPLRVPAVVWALLVFASPALGVIAYWFVNRRVSPPDETTRT